MRHQYIIALVIFLAALACVFSWKISTQRALQASAIQLIAPINNATTNLSRKMQAAAQGLQTLPQLEEENKILKVQNEQLRIKNEMFENLAQENDTLRKALDFKARSSFKLVPAKVIARESSSWWSIIQINRGERDGLDTDMPVVIDEGLVGKTTTVAANSSYVLLIADENCKVAGTIQGTRESGILSGERASNTTQPELYLNFLAKTAAPSLRPGQKVFSSGVGGVFPSGLLLGTIKSVEARPLDARAKVTPAVDLTNLENVFVIVGEQEVKNETDHHGPALR